MHFAQPRSVSAIKTSHPRRRIASPRPTLDLPPDSPFLSDEVARRIGFRASRLRRKNGLGFHDEQDFRQDLWLNLLQAAVRFDPAKCSLQRYVSMVLNSRYKHHLRELTQKREEAAGPVESDTCSLEGLGDEGQKIRDSSAEQNSHRAVLAQDVQVVLDGLSDGDRKIVCAPQTPSVFREPSSRRCLHTQHGDVRWRTSGGTWNSNHGGGSWSGGICRAG